MWENWSQMYEWNDKRHLLSPKWSHIDCRFDVWFLPFFSCLLSDLSMPCPNKKRFFIIPTRRAYCCFFAQKHLFFSLNSLGAFLKTENKKKSQFLKWHFWSLKGQNFSHTDMIFCSHIYFELFNLENQFEWERHTNQK